MFKKNKLNENNIKKDFYAKKSNKSIIDCNYSFNSKNTNYLIVDKIFNLELPNQGDSTKILTNKNNSSIDILPKDVEELVLICSRIDEKSILKLDRIDNKYLILSNVIKDKKESIYNLCVSKFKDVLVLKNHCKMILFKNTTGSYVILTSANPSINARNEFYNIHNNEQLYKNIRECLKSNEINLRLI